MRGGSKTDYFDAKRRAKEMMSEAERQYHPMQMKKQRAGQIDKLAKEGLDDANRLIAPHRVMKQEDRRHPIPSTETREVSIPDLKAEGVILSIDGETALVQVGAIRQNFRCRNCVRKKQKQQTSYSYFRHESKKRPIQIIFVDHRNRGCHRSRKIFGRRFVWRG